MGKCLLNVFLFMLIIFPRLVDSVVTNTNSSAHSQTRSNTITFHLTMYDDQ